VLLVAAASGCAVAITAVRAEVVRVMVVVEAEAEGEVFVGLVAGHDTTEAAGGEPARHLPWQIHQGEGRGNIKQLVHLHTEAKQKSLPVPLSL
jgi:hypothetical protein